MMFRVMTICGISIHNIIPPSFLPLNCRLTDNKSKRGSSDSISRLISCLSASPLRFSCHSPSPTPYRRSDERDLWDHKEHDEHTLVASIEPILSLGVYPH